MITPMAREIALERKVSLATARPMPQPSGKAEQTIALGADHGGYGLKEQLKPFPGQARMAGGGLRHEQHGERRLP